MLPFAPANGVTTSELIAKIALTAAFAFNEIEHVPVPVQPPPDHPVKIERDADVAVNVTIVPAL